MRRFLIALILLAAVSEFLPIDADQRRIFRPRRSAPGGPGCTVTVANTDDAVQAEVDTRPNGSVICVQSGTASWNETVTIPNTKGLTIQGAGIGNTIIDIDVPDVDLRHAFEVHVTTGNALTRITGFTIDDQLNGSMACGTFCAPIAVIGQGVNAFRIDHNRIERIAQTSGGIFLFASSSDTESGNGAELSGLIDNNVFTCNDSTNTSCHSIAFHSSPAWDTNLATSLAAGWGAAFARDVAPGLGLASNKSVYIEDNNFDLNGHYNDGCMDTFGSAQVVFRYNITDGCSPGNHGNDSAGYRGMRWFEVYANTIALGTAGSACVVNRGGVMLFFDNTCTHPSDPKDVALQIFRARPETFIAGIGQCDGGSTLDGNAGSGTNTSDPYPGIGTGENPGWPCIDQNGYHFDENGGAGYVSYPTYIFNNNDGLGGEIATINYETSYGNLQNYMKCNRDHYIRNTSFDGAATVGNCATGGVGRGARASRPATCTTGTSWWSTDQGGNWNTSNGSANDGTLDKCTATDTWTNAYYTPYTYPHPLR